MIRIYLMVVAVSMVLAGSSGSGLAQSQQTAPEAQSTTSGDSGNAAGGNGSPSGQLEQPRELWASETGVEEVDKLYKEFDMRQALQDLRAAAPNDKQQVVTLGREIVLQAEEAWQRVERAYATAPEALRAKWQEAETEFLELRREAEEELDQLAKSAGEQFTRARDAAADRLSQLSDKIEAQYEASQDIETSSASRTRGQGSGQ